MISKTTITVRYAETDQMGIVHHSSYAIWYEEARTNFIKDLNISYSEIEKIGLFLPVTNICSKYIKPAFYEDKITIFTKIKNISCVKIEFYYELFNQNNILINKGSTTHPFIDKSFNLINIKKQFKDIYNILINSYEN